MWRLSRVKFMQGVAVVMVAVAVSGCSNGLGQIASCERYGGTYSIEYVGGALGKGELALSLVEGRADLLQGRLTLRDDTGTNAVLSLEGPGSCDDGIVNLVFGGGDHPESRVRVIGGNATLVPAGGKVAQLFGIWNAQALIKDNGEQRSLSGYFRESGRS